MDRAGDAGSRADNGGELAAVRAWYGGRSSCPVLAMPGMLGSHLQDGDGETRFDPPLLAPRARLFGINQSLWSGINCPV